MAKPPYWRLLSVIFSAFPLPSALAMTLYEAARALHESGGGSQEIGGDTLSGKVRNLRREVVMGGIAGPLFEANVESDAGSGLVRFLLTREGLEEQPSRPELRN